MKDNKSKLKIAVACSTGGHLFEVKRLASVYQGYEHFYFTFKGGVADKLKEDERVYAIPNIIRQNPISWVVGAVLSFWIALKERPDLIVTTGAGIVVLFCVFSKMFGAKIIFLESMARVEKPTLTARMLYPFSDLFLVQWENLLKFFPKAKYVGRIY